MFRQLDIADFKHFCPQIFKDYNFLNGVTLLESPYAKGYLGAMWALHPKTYNTTIELSSRVLDMHDGHVKETFIHELVHVVNYFFNGCYSGHGKIFRDTFSLYTGMDRSMVRRYHQGIFDEDLNLKARFKPLEEFLVPGGILTSEVA